MTTYRSAIGHNQSLASLVSLSPQPRSTGVQVTRRAFTGVGVRNEGLYVELIWSVVRDQAEYELLLTPFGLHDNAWQNVTVYIRNELFEFARYNGTAIRPDPVWENYFPKLTVLVRDLVKLP